MIDPDHRDPCRIAMATLAHITRLDMGGMLTRCRGAVMAAEAVTRNRGVIEVRRYPGIGRMTEIAGVIAGNMVRRLTRCGGAVMTAETGADHIGMINPNHRYPSRVAMAILAHIRGEDVRGVFTSRYRAIMAAETTACGSGMIKVGWYPGIGRMAGFTIAATLNVQRMFTGGNGAVMAA